MGKIPDFVLKCEHDFGIKLIYKNEIKMYYLKKSLKKPKKIANEEGVVFVYGKDKRKSPIQKSIEKLCNYN